MNYGLILLLSVFSLHTFGADLLPKGCKPLAVTEELLSLTSKKQTVVLLYNKSKEDLWITHPVSDAGASAGWSSHLQAVGGRHWLWVRNPLT